jgi:hypothetical protein
MQYFCQQAQQMHPSQGFEQLICCCCWCVSLLGVTVDRDVRQGAAIMAGSVLLYGTVQVPAFLGASNSPQVRVRRVSV